MTIAERFKAHPSNYGARRGTKIDTVVLHTTQGLGALRGTISWFQNPAAKVSAHYLLGQNGVVYELVDEEDSAWHAGNFNRRSVGVEVEGDAFNKDTWTPLVLDRLAVLVADLCDRHRIEPVRKVPGVVGHSDLGAAGGGHQDPGPHFPWESFLLSVRGELDRRRGEALAAA